MNERENEKMPLLALRARQFAEQFVEEVGIDDPEQHASVVAELTGLITKEGQLIFLRTGGAEMLSKANRLCIGRAT